MNRVLILVAATVAACRTGGPRPVDIEASDMCSLCRMAISQRQYAAELIDSEGTAFKFDDIGCFVRFAAGRGPHGKLPPSFVIDYDSRQWLGAGRAYYVKSKEIRSPMASGLIALKEKAKADEYASKFQGRVMLFDELWTE